jgi:integrase
MGRIPDKVRQRIDSHRRNNLVHPKLLGQVLETELPWLDNVARTEALRRLLVVLTYKEMHGVLARLSGTHWLVGSLLHGAGMRPMEAIRLRVKDVEFARGEIIVREGKV